MKFIAIKELPQGQQPGEVFEATEAEGDVLIMVGAARKATDAEKRRGYARKDIQAQEPA